jgi:hypothetical protein
MMLLRLHVGNLTTRDIPRHPHRATAVHDLAAAAAVLEWIEVFTNLPVVPVRVDRLVLVEARDRSHLLLHQVLRLHLRVLGMVILMAVDDDRRRSIVLVVVTNIDVRSR